jgi:hypothetical protein
MFRTIRKGFLAADKRKKNTQTSNGKFITIRPPIHISAFPRLHFLHASSSSTRSVSKMDSSKVPVKLVKVTRVLGRTGTQASSIAYTFLRIGLRQMAMAHWRSEHRLKRRCYPSPRRVHGWYHSFHHSQRQGPRYGLRCLALESGD